MKAVPGILPGHLGPTVWVGTATLGDFASGYLIRSLHGESSRTARASPTCLGATGRGGPGCAISTREHPELAALACATLAQELCASRAWHALERWATRPSATPFCQLTRRSKALHCPETACTLAFGLRVLRTQERAGRVGQMRASALRAAQASSQTGHNHPRSRQYGQELIDLRQFPASEL